jgi:Carbohydrate esterase, sialic acid-specific acetylesterase
VRDSGSVWPLLATRIMKWAKVPVAFIPVPYSGSSIADWQCNEAWPDDPGTLYGNMLRRVTRAGGAVRAVLLWQGEWDAGSGQVDEASYESALSALAEATQRDLGVRLVVCQTGEIRWRQSTPPVAPFLDGIRMAQLHSWAWSDVVAPGPQLYDILLHTATEDRVHYRTPDQLATVSRRWWCAVAAGCYGQGDGRGPRITGASYEAAGPSITLRFTDDDLPLSLPAGDLGAAFTVRDDSGDVTVTAVQAVGTSELRLRLARSATGALHVSLGEGHLGAVNPVPHDSGRWRLPAELFVDYPVAVP